jgi:hypothetical protein
MTKTEKEKELEVIYEWDNVDWDNGGGTIGEVTSDGMVKIEHLSNITGSKTGIKSKWQLSATATAEIADDPDVAYNDHNSWSDMVQGSGIAYIADLISETGGILVQ